MKKCYIVYLHHYQERLENPQDEILQVFKEWSDAADYIAKEVQQDALKMDPEMNIQQVLRDFKSFEYTTCDFGYKIGIVEKSIK